MIPMPKLRVHKLRPYIKGDVAAAIEGERSRRRCGYLMMSRSTVLYDWTSILQTWTYSFMVTFFVRAQRLLLDEILTFYTTWTFLLVSTQH
jgi:hypothetical protein